MRLRSAFVLAVVVLLAGCTTTVGGTGHYGTGSSSSSPPSEPPVDETHRVPQDGPLGDLVTANLCGGIQLQGLARFGYARVHGWQTATTCYIDLLLRDGDYLQLNSWGEQNSEFYNFDGTLPRSVHGVGDVYAFRPHGTDCERALEIDPVVIETHVYNVRGHIPDRVRCAVSSTWLRLELKAFGHSPPPRRATSRPSLTDFNLCEVVVQTKYRSLRGFADAYTSPFLQNAGCTVHGSPVVVSMRVAFLNLDFPVRGRSEMVRGHRINFEKYGHDCEAISLQGTTSDGRTREILDAIAHVTGRRGADQTCSVAVRLSAAFLSAAHLH